MNKKDLKNIENLKEVKKDKSADRAVLIAGVIIVILMLAGIYLYRGYVTKKSMIENKVTEHMRKVEEGKKMLSEKMDRKVVDLKKEMEPLLDKKDDIRMKTDEVMEYERVNSLRKTERAEQEREDEQNCMLSILMGDDSCKKEYMEKYNRSQFWQKETHDELYDYINCYKEIQDDLFRFRSWVIAKHNLVKKYKKDIARIESLSEIDDWERATLNKKKVFIEDAKKYDQNATDEELVQMILSNNPNSVVNSCVAMAKKAIPILVKYDGGNRVPIHLKELKKTADYFGIAKEIDWTVPVMVVEEEKESKEYMDKWRAEYCNDKKHKEQCIKTPSYNENPNTRIFNKKTSIESCKYLKEMDEKYEALGDNPGLKYPIFTVYRQYTLNHKGCAKKGIYPENTRLQKLISEEQKIRDKFFTSTDEDKRLKYLKREIEMEQEKNEKLMKKW
jgi:hypothetical protein